MSTDAAIVEAGSPAGGIYETSRSLREYLLLHYASGPEILPYPFGPHDAVGYPVRCARAALAECDQAPGRALDLGCAVGGASFELARECRSVLGIDRSTAFIAAAERLKRDGAIVYERLDEGDRRSSLVARLPEGIALDRVSFEVGDACALPPSCVDFDLLLAANLLDRLPDPRAWLRDLPARVRPGGVLFLSSPYTWLEEFTPPSNWLGNVGGDSSFEELSSILEPSFELLRRRDMPFLLREHARKYQWSVADATVWRRRA